MSAQLTSFGITDQGRTRKANEDQFLIANFDGDQASSYTGLDSSTAMLQGGDEQLLAVADGLGGHRGGAIASSIAVQTLSEAMSQLHRTATIGTDAATRLRDIIQCCNREIFDAGFHNAELHGMGTTVTAALVHEDSVWIAHAGDSRCYLLGESSIEQLTTDHTLAELLGRDTPGHVLWNCLGGRQNREAEVQLVQCKLKPTDCLLLCTDGLTRHVETSEILEVIQSVGCLETSTRRLVAMANDRGGEDNVTIVAAQRNSTAAQSAMTATKAAPMTSSLWNHPAIRYATRRLAWQ